MSSYRDKCQHCDQPHADLYIEYPTCNDCYDRVCEDCSVPDSVYEDEGRLRCQCLFCWEDEQQEEDDEGFEDEDISDVDFED